MIRETQSLSRMHIPERGVTVTVPLRGLDSGLEEGRYHIVAGSGILRNRYPTSRDGQAFMENVDHEWGETLKGYAYQLTGKIIEEWQQISPHKPIAVLLFGSIARGLVKKPDHCDPSNIDLTVIGEIDKEERNMLLDGIRDHRADIQKDILANCPNLDSHEHNPGNANVLVQDVSKLKSDGYHAAIRYIDASAYPLYDPSEVWRQIEAEALEHYVFSKKRRRPIQYTVYET